MANIPPVIAPTIIATMPTDGNMADGFLNLVRFIVMLVVQERLSQ